ncbi:MAG: GNAT family N-acetyltransferase, partial [Myxococcaceae bacterium]|nr:GNAT family N-acetyltransferase [Myxococcaceae bacterium]
VPLPLDGKLCIQAQGKLSRTLLSRLLQHKNMRVIGALRHLQLLSGQLSLYFLRLGERAIAFHYGIASGQTYYLPKVGFDEALGDCSPGQVLMDLVVRDLIQRGTTRFDFLGPSMAWKRDWTRQTRPHHWLYLFADTRRGRLLRWLKSLDVGALVGRGRGRGGR